MRPVVVVAFVALAIQGACSSASTTPVPAELGRLADEVFRFGLERDPTWGSYLGYRAYDARLPDLSAAAFAARRQQRVELLSALRREADAADARGELGARVIAHSLAFRLGTDLDLDRCRQPDHDVDALAGWQVTLPTLATFTRLDSPQAGADYLLRLSRMAALYDQHLDNLAAGLRDGWVPTRLVVDRVIGQLDAQLAEAAESSPFVAAAQAATFTDADGKARLAAEVVTIVRTGLQPALLRYRDFLATQLRPKAREVVGIAALPDGAACYEALARGHTTSTLGAKELHERGLAEVTRLRAAMLEIAKTAGHPNIDAYVAALRADPAQHLDSADALLGYNRAILARAQAALPRAFLRLPKAPVELRPIEPFRAEAAPAAYYYQAPDDGSRPAYYYLNTLAPTTRPLFNMEALAFHEAVPGHHLQIALAQERRELPDAMRHGEATAFVEGWGLYAELLADELGLYSSAAHRFGMLTYQAWRAARLVVDTGMHAFAWNRDRARQYMIDNVALPVGEIDNEIDRYITWPGQALAYMTGRMHFQDLRHKAEKSLGSDFSLPAFHEALLRHGAVPLPVASLIIDDFIARGGEL